MRVMKRRWKRMPCHWHISNLLVWVLLSSHFYFIDLEIHASHVLTCTAITAYPSGILNPIVRRRLYHVLTSKSLRSANPISHFTEQTLTEKDWSQTRFIAERVRFGSVHPDWLISLGSLIFSVSDDCDEHRQTWHGGVFRSCWKRQSPSFVSFSHTDLRIHLHDANIQCVYVPQKIRKQLVFFLFGRRRRTNRQTRWGTMMVTE